MATKPRKANITDGENADTEAFKYAVSQWGEKACVVKRLPAPPDRPNVLYEVGMLQGGVFNVYGSGATWTEAMYDARHHIQYVGTKYTREKS